MSQKKRIRDRLFPEGGKTRSYLRTANRFVKSIFSIKYLKEQKNKIKEKGWRVTWIEMKRYMVMGTAAEPENRTADRLRCRPDLQTASQSRRTAAVFSFSCPILLTSALRPPCRDPAPRRSRFWGRTRRRSRPRT